MISRKLPFLLLLLAGALLLSFFIFRPFLVPLSLAAVFAVVLRPFYRTLLAFTGGREILAAFLTVCISVVVVLVPLGLIGTGIFEEARELYTTLTDMQGVNLLGTYVARIGGALGGFFPGAENFFATISADLDVYVRQGLEWLLNHLGSVLSSITKVLLEFFIFFVALFYALRDGPKLKRSLVSLSPLDDADDEFVFRRLEVAINSVIKGNLTIALIQGVLTAVGLAIFGVPNSLLWGTVAAVAALIPGVGTALVLLPAIIYLFFVGNTFQSLGLLLWGILAVGLVDNVLGPKLVGGAMRLHPMFVLLSVLGGIAFFGPVGIFLGPLTLSLLFAFITIYSYLTNPAKQEK